MFLDNTYILQAPKSAPSNSKTTDEFTSGVEQDYKALSPDYKIAGGNLVSLAEDQYRVSVLSNSENGRHEILMWAANTAKVCGSVKEVSASFQISSGNTKVDYVYPNPDPNNPLGGPFKGFYEDGSLSFYLFAEGTIEEILALKLVRGDTGEEIPLTQDQYQFDSLSGKVLLISEAVLQLLGGGLSQQRKDSILATVRLSGPQFWWTKNDAVTRFGWNGRLGRWAPLRGSSVGKLGIVSETETYSVAPFPPLASLGSRLEGDPNNPSEYSSMRVGDSPNELSIPVRVLVSDDATTFEANVDAILLLDGSLVLNPVFAKQHAGLALWYFKESFSDSQESVGTFGEDLYLSPVPRRTEYPFIKIGNRQHLQAWVVSNEDELSLLQLEEGQVGVSLSTGRLRFSEWDLGKVDSKSSLFDPSYLGAEVFYDGVAACQKPVPLKDKVALVGSDGNPIKVGAKNDLFLLDARPTPGLGVSGVLLQRDGTGQTPNLSTVPGVRPNGSGLTRTLGSVGDFVLFSENGQISKILSIDNEQDIPKYRFKIPRGTVYVHLEKSGVGSPVHLGKEDRKRFAGKYLYFIQARATPSLYVTEAVIGSIHIGPIQLRGDEVFQFRINDVTHTWDASVNPGGVQTALGGTFSPQEIASSLNSILTNGSAICVRGQIFLQSGLIVNGKRYGEIEIGYNLEANAALGFLPGWLVRVASNPFNSSSDLRWLPIDGTSLGVFRSPLNLDGSQNIPDIRHQDKYDDVVLFDAIPSSPVILLQRSPLEDLPGYDQNCFFQSQVGLETRNLKTFEHIIGDFARDRFLWATETRQVGEIHIPTLEIGLSSIPAFPLSFQASGKGFRVSRGGGVYETLTPDEDYLVENNSIVLTETVGSFHSEGGSGTFVAESPIFEDPKANFAKVLPGYQLDIAQGGSQGTYTVEEILSNTQLRVRPAFSTTEDNSNWSLYEGKSISEIDAGVIADVQYETFNHLPEDPFRIRLLSPLGTMPSSPPEQQNDRRQAILADALNSNRKFVVRIGDAHSSPSLSPIALQRIVLGMMANGMLYIPQPSSDRFKNGNFTIAVGSELFPSSAITKVAEFSEPLLEGIQVRVSDGQLKFGADVFSSLENQTVVYREGFLDASSLAQGRFEYDPFSGYLNFSMFEISQYGGQPIFFVETMNTSQGDVIVNPIGGSFLFAKPLRPKQRVEADYFLAQSGTGDLFLSKNEQGELVPTRVIEFLPRLISLESAIHETDLVWRFNPEENTIDSDSEIRVYIGSTQCNVGSSPVANIQGSTVVFQQPVSSDKLVRVSYSVFEAQGGEQTFSATHSPIYRPPFRIEAGKESFVLEGDRSDLEKGQLLRVAQFPFYITSVLYNEQHDKTIVGILPETQVEAGSRDPSTNSLSLISDRPIALDLSAKAFSGFWIGVDSSFEPINRGMQHAIFEGDLTSLAIVGHVLELGGVPFLISGSEVLEGGKTRIDITGVFPKGFASGQDKVRISVRPIYPSNSQIFLGRGAILATKPFKAIRFGSDGLGRPLQIDVDYTVDFDTGSVTLNQGLQPQEKLYLRQTRRIELAPSFIEGQLINPRFIATYLYNDRPSSKNGLLGTPLRAKYTFDAPDTFYYRIVPGLEYMGEVAQEVRAQASALLPSSGSPLLSFSSSGQGRFGLRGEISNLQHKDRVARHFIGFYNETIAAFEQIQESISGQIVGDRDGKFRFFVGRGNPNVPPGYEDPITGLLNPRNIFADLWFSQNRGIFLKVSDPLVDPQGATLQDNEVVGPFIDPDLLDQLISEQTHYVENDIDDVVLTSRTKKKLRLFPLRLEAFGRYSRIGSPSNLSRLFPQRTEVFTQLDPGIGANLEQDDVGVYAFSKYVGRFSINGNGLQLPERASTYQRSIGEVTNPVLGRVEDISTIRIQDRRPRAVIYRYSPVGFPELDALILNMGGQTFGANPRPAVIATPLRLKDFPITSQGLPDVLQLAAQGGELFDLTTGDPDLSTPPFETLSGNYFPKVSFGKPSGRVIDVTNGQKVGFEFPPGSDNSYFEGLYVKEVLLGCILTFADQQGNSITSPFQIQQLSPSEQETSGIFEPAIGDTIFVSPSNMNPFLGGVPNDPITQIQRSQVLSGAPDYRVGFDVKIDHESGEILDISFPSFWDPNPLGMKEILGQNPPTPFSCIEGMVKFKNSQTSPLQIPALLGQDLSDSGDREIPYLTVPDSEISVLSFVQQKFNEIFEDTVEPGAAYPNEVLGVDGVISEGKMTTFQNFLPGYVEGSGTMNVRPFDFLFIETVQNVPQSMQGILSIGKVTNHEVVVPRFVSPTKLGSRIRYQFNNAMAWVNEPFNPTPPGMVVRRVGPTTILDISDISSDLLVFNDGTPAVVSGGLNTIFDPGGVHAYPNNDNILRINLFDIETRTYLQTLTVEINNGSPQITGDLGTEPFIAAPSATDKELRFETANPFVTIGAGGSPELPEDPNNPGESKPLWFTIDVVTVGGASYTGQILPDRVTFRESYDLRTVRNRDEPPVDNFDVTGQLEVFFVTGAGTDSLTVNNSSEVNGGFPFTFRKSGTFSSGIGTIEVPGFEGFGNQEIDATDVKFAALASSDYDGVGVIASGIGVAESSTSASDRDFRISGITIDVSRVRPGDVLVISQDNQGNATTKAGTYLVKHAIAPNNGIYRSLVLETQTYPMNTKAGWLQVEFPQLESIDIDGTKIRLSNTVLSDGSSSWGTTGRIYFIQDPLDIASTISLAYLSLDNSTHEFTILQGSGLDANGNLVLDSVFANLKAGTFVTGFQWIEVDFSCSGEDTLPRNLVGHQGDGTFTYANGGSGFGFREIQISNVNAEVFTYEQAPGAANNLIVGSPATDQIGLEAHTPIPNTAFVGGPNAIVYDNVCSKLNLSKLSALQWANIHGVTAVEALFPGDTVLAKDFRAQAGIFLEPSIPRPVQDYLGPNAKVVDATHSLAVNQIGFRDGPSYGALITPEQVTFEVRRIRRFQDVLSEIGENLHSLRYLYQIRRGTITGYGPKPVGPKQMVWPFVLEAQGTNLGGFLDPKVNIHPQDRLRVIGEDGNLLEEIEIVAIEDDHHLLLRSPGIQSSDPVGKSFEVYLRNAPVPFEQSYEQLLSHVAEKEILLVKADYVTQTGGSVPVEQDPFTDRRLVDNSVDFLESGVREGDIILVDPAGPVQGPTGIPVGGQEYGSRPFGDRSVPSRTTNEGSQEVPFVPGQPSELDDNRGWYRVTKVAPHSLTVSSQTEFSSNPGDDPVVFGDVVQYAIYPTISGSTAPFAFPPGGPGMEGQMDLRPTAYAGEAGSPPNSFRGNLFSIAPFSYRIVRPSPLFSKESIDLILCGRERTLSWIEEFDAFFRGQKSGNYFVFQRDQHIRDLGNPLIPEEGLGVISNELVNNVRGEVHLSPFANTTDCLSILDRRFWILDTKLDYEFPANQNGVPSYSAFETSANVPNAPEFDGRPVLLDRIDEVLNTNDQLREKRYFWIDFRVNRESGVLSQIETSKKEFEKRRQDMIRQMKIVGEIS